MPRSHRMTSDLLAGPPPEVLAEVDAAWERAQVGLQGGLELHLAAAGRRAWGELRRADGTVERMLTATEVVALACGDAFVPPEPALAV